MPLLDLLRRVTGGSGPPCAVGFRSFGTRDRLYILGRALEDARLLAADPTHSRLRNFAEALKRFDAEPIAHARVQATFGADAAVFEADDEGYVHHWLALSAPLERTGWHAVALTLPGSPSAPAGVAHVLVPSDAARFGVVSDIDDTVLQSHVATPLHAARMMLFENARTRLPFPGVAAFYRALVAGSGDDGNPIFYISSSPWNVHGVLADFLDAQGIPLGPLLLRDWDLSRSLLANGAHKSERIRDVFATYPAMRFILVGDTSQEDPEIYADAVRTHPGRVLAIYIRDVGASAERRAALAALVDAVRQDEVPLLLAPDTLTIARHASAQGWIDAAHLAAIGEEKREDEGTAPGKSAETP